MTVYLTIFHPMLRRRNKNMHTIEAKGPHKHSLQAIRALQDPRSCLAG